MTTATDAETAAAVAALVEAQAKTRQAVTSVTVAAVLRQVRAFHGWHDHRAITELAHTIAAVVAPRQRVMAGVTDAYMARVLSAMRGKAIAPTGAIKVEGLRQGTTLEGAYGRLADQYRYLESKGMTEVDVLQRVVNRAEVMAETDITLADVHQAAKVLDTRATSARIDGFRRVIHPELSRTGTCGLCIVASDRIYKVRELMPIHGRCRCEALPIVNGVDPGRNLNEDDFKAVYGAANSTRGRKLKETRFQVNEHGELGPMLGYKGQHFRGPNDIPDLTPNDTPVDRPLVDA